jgi:hypothetical protein
MKITFLPLAISFAVAFSSAAFAEAPAPKVLFSEDFENVPVGEIPKGFTKTGAVAVSEDAAHSGHKSLKMEAAVKGARKITLQGAPLVELGGEHWGRLYFKVKLPAPSPIIPEGKTSGIIHSTIVDGTATSPLANDKIDLRLLNTVLHSDGAFSYLFNVQPPKGRKEFGPGTKSRFHYTDEWTLAEWHVDYATQSFQFFINGEEIPELAIHKGAGQFEGAEIPAVFETLSFGFTNYQPASGEGFVTWIDDLAVGKERIGGGVVPPMHIATAK